jgi:hypothetical protein
MTKNKNEMKPKKGYTIVEPDIYEKLNWDMDLIISCLDIIRKKMSIILNIQNENIEYDLIALTNFLGQSYPVIGIYNLDPKEYEWIDIDEITNNWIKNYDVEAIIKDSINNKTINWVELQKLGTYPNRTNTPG